MYVRIKQACSDTITSRRQPYVFSIDKYRKFFARRRPAFIIMNRALAVFQARTAVFIKIKRIFSVFHPDYCFFSLQSLFLISREQICFFSSQNKISFSAAVRFALFNAILTQRFSRSVRQNIGLHRGLIARSV